MGDCIAFAGCQAIKHIRSCAKFDQRTDDLQEIEWAFMMAEAEGYDADSGRAALKRLLGETS